MILYYGVTHYHFLCAMLHKMKYHKNDKAVLLIPERINDSLKFKRIFEKAEIFTDIILYGEPRVDSSDLSPAGIEHEIDGMVQYIETEFPVVPSQFEEINVAGDHYAFGVYLVKKGIPYNFFEEGCGRLSTEKELMSHVKKIWPIREFIIQELKLFGNSEIVKYRYGDLHAQAKGYENPKDVHFSVTEILSERSEEEIACIIQAFTGKTEFHLEAEGNLLLTQHFINLNLMNYMEQELLYKILADYFAEEGPLVIKPHPSDIQGVYSKWFPNAVVLDRMLPSELIPYCVKGAGYKTGISASSTSIHGLADYITEIICFSQMIEKSYMQMDQYYTALRCIEQLKIGKNVKLILLGGGINLSQIKLLCQHYHMNLKHWKKMLNMREVKKAKLKGRKIFLVSNLPATGSESNFKKFKGMFRDINDNDVILFLPNKKKTIFASEATLEEIKNILPIAIDTFQEENGKRRQIKREYIYMYTRNKEYLQEVFKMSERKVMKYSGLEIEIEPSKQAEVKILEGINEALEKRVVELASAYKKMKKVLEENEEWKNSMLEYKEESEKEMEKLLKENEKYKKSRVFKLTHKLKQLLK